MPFPASTIQAAVLERIQECLKISRWTSAPTNVMNVEIRQTTPTILMLKIWTSSQDKPTYFTIRVTENPRTRRLQNENP